MKPTPERYVFKKQMGYGVMIYLMISALFGFLAETISLEATVSFAGRQILVNGQSFRMQGVSYSPTPIGLTADQPPYGDYFTTNYRSIYQRDLPLMRQMGVNCLRIYGWSLTNSHTEFLDQAFNNGKQPIYVIVNRWVDPNTDWASTNAVNAIKTEWQTLANAVKNHPALLGYAIGNELNFANGSKPAFWSALNSIAGAVRTVDATHLITTPMGDGDLASQIQTYNVGLTNLNCWSVQMFRGSNFGGFFSQYAGISSKPLLVLEFGIDALDQGKGSEYTNNAMLQATYIQSLWHDILSHSNIVSGGAVFSWTDEWWKTAGSLSAHGAGGWSNSAFPDGWVDEEWWGIHRVATGNPNALQPRAAYEVLRALWFIPAAAPVLSTPTFSTNGQCRISVSGTSGYEYVLSSSSNLMNWLPRQTNLTPFIFTDSNSPGRSYQFYRGQKAP